jgi:CheY-like chemotaxis protein
MVRKNDNREPGREQVISQNSTAKPDVEIDASPKHVLVVDDDVVIRLVIAEVMRDEGLSVIEARSGEDAAGYLKSGGRADLIFSDIHMPGSMDGLQLARYVRETYPFIPVILTSGGIVPQGLNGVVKFIAKPFRLNSVLEMVLETLNAAGDAANE